MTILVRFSLRGLWRAGVVAALWCGAWAAHAEARIESVTGSIQGGSELVRIELSEPLAAPPKGFAIQSPARIALDFPGVTNAMGRSAVEVNQGNLRSVNVVQAGDRTRVVLNLKQFGRLHHSNSGQNTSGFARTGSECGSARPQRAIFCREPQPRCASVARP